MNLIARPYYLKTLNTYQNNGLIKVISGMRRCGKSTIMKMFIESLKQQGIAEERIIYIDLEDFENFGQITSIELLSEYVSKKTVSSQTTYVLVDEIQNLENFQKLLASWNGKKTSNFENKYDVYVTGSNAKLLSGKLATLISGRYMQIDILPLSFKEYYEYKKDSKKTKMEIFTNYFKNSSLPIAVEKNQTIEEIKYIYDSIYYRDIQLNLEMASKENYIVLDRIISFLIENIGNIISANKIANALTSANYKISVKKVLLILEAITNSYIFRRVDRYDLRWHEKLKVGSKYYLADMGMKQSYKTKISQDNGRIIENLVFNELLRRKYDVQIGKIYNNEIDFIVSKNNYQTVEYFQVAWEINNSQETFERELKPLLALNDNYPKTIITMDNLIVNDSYKGINHVNLIDWLLDNDY